MYLKPSLWIDKAAKNELPMENINRKYHWTTRERQRYSQYDLNIEPFSKTKHLSHIKKNSKLLQWRWLIIKFNLQVSFNNDHNERYF